MSKVLQNAQQILQDTNLKIRLLLEVNRSSVQLYAYKYKFLIIYISLALVNDKMWIYILYICLSRAIWIFVSEVMCKCKRN